jgi:hypothetical protein
MKDGELMKHCSVRVNEEFLIDSKSVSKQVNESLKFIRMLEEVLEDNTTNSIKIEKIKMLYDSIIK